MDQTRGKSMVIKNDNSNMNNQIGRLIFLVWTADLKPWAVKKSCTWSRLLAIYTTVPILHWFSPKTEIRITFCNGALLSIGAPCVKALVSPSWFLWDMPWQVLPKSCHTSRMVMEPKNSSEKVIRHPNHYLTIWLDAQGTLGLNLWFSCS